MRRHEGIARPNACSILALDIAEYLGRWAGSGYSFVEIGRRVFALKSVTVFAFSSISLAKPYQEISPSTQMVNAGVFRQNHRLVAKVRQQLGGSFGDHATPGRTADLVIDDC